MFTGMRAELFYGWRIVGAAFVLAIFGWGFGFYGPPIFLSVIRETRGWPVALVSAAVTVHFLVGAVAGANLPALHRRLGVPAATMFGAAAMSVGVVGWAIAASPWQLFVAALLSGMGWGGMSAAALNAIIAPWFDRERPAALAMAYNGGSVGGIVFSSLWVGSIGALGFPMAATVAGVIMALAVWALAAVIFVRTPAAMGQRPDGDGPGAPAAGATSPTARPLPGSLLWRDRRFVTLAAGMALGLFAQIGLFAHLYSLLTPVLGEQLAGLAMGLVTAMAIAGRTLTGRLLPPGADRRIVACGGYALQLAGSIMFILAAGANVPFLLLAVVLLGAGFGNATSLPPLIAQVEFVKEDVPRVVALVVGIAQGGFAFAPAVFGLVRTFQPHHTGATPALFAAAALVQSLAIGAFLAGRRR